AILAAVYAGFVYLLVRYARSRGRTALGLAGRSLVALIGGAGVWLVVDTILTRGRPRALVVTIIYVRVDVSVHYLLAPRLPPLLRGVVSAPDDDHAGGRRLPVPDAHRHEQGAALSTLDTFRSGRRLLGHQPVGRTPGSDDRRRLAVDAIHLHRARRGPREPAG